MKFSVEDKVINLVMRRHPNKIIWVLLFANRSNTHIKMINFIFNSVIVDKSRGTVSIQHIFDNNK